MLLKLQRLIIGHTRVPNFCRDISKPWVCSENVSFVSEVDGCYTQAFSIDFARAVGRFKEARGVQRHFEIRTCTHKETAAWRLLIPFPLKPGPDKCRLREKKKQISVMEGRAICNVTPDQIM